MVLTPIEKQVETFLQNEQVVGVEAGIDTHKRVIEESGAYEGNTAFHYN